tara:strand:+ start:1695 stop:2183 length:489 start_codon:yes stop_codon:yes gene_type:complete
MKKEEIEQRLAENKQERKQLKQQLKDLPSLEVGKWYVSGTALVFITKEVVNSTVVGYGVCGDSEWTDNFYMNFQHEYIPANDKEVEEALVKEAKKRGFNPQNYSYHVTGDLKGNLYGWDRYSDAIDIFIKGKWVEIIQHKTVHMQAGNYTEVQLKDILNSQF